MRDLPAGLQCDSRGYFTLRHPVTGERKRVGSDKATALRLRDIVWQAARDDLAAAALAKFEKRAASGPRPTSVADYMAAWRAKTLPTLTTRSGKPLGEKTRGDYERMLRRQLEPLEQFAEPLSTVSPQIVRAALARWIGQPAQYNYVKAVLSAVFRSAVDEGLIPTTPMPDVARRAVAKRQTYITDEHYRAIRAEMPEYMGYALDLLYLVSHRPTDVLALGEANLDGRMLRFVPRKTVAKRIEIEIECNAALLEVIDWWREFGRGIVGRRTWCVHPVGSDRRISGKPITRDHLSRAFNTAMRAAGLSDYQLRDVRPKGLTDDWLIGGESDKGGHKTAAMREHYRRVTVPMRSKNNLAVIPRKAG